MSRFMITLRNTSTVDDYVIHSNEKCLSRKKVSLSVSGSNLTFNGVYNLLSSIYKRFVSNLWANYDVNYCQSYSANIVNSNFLELIPPSLTVSSNLKIIVLLTLYPFNYQSSANIIILASITDISGGNTQQRT